MLCPAVTLWVMTPRHLSLIVCAALKFSRWNVATAVSGGYWSTIRWMVVDE